MSTRTLAQRQTRVLLICGNEESSNPIVSGGLHTQAINSAVNRLIRMVNNADLFPEKHVRVATAAATSVGSNTIALPTSPPIAIVTRVTRTESASAPTLADTTEVEMVLSTVDEIGILDKTTAVVDFPSLWARYGESIMYYPTTRTGKTTYLVVYGIAEEAAISASDATFGLNARWDDAIDLLAASEVELMLNHPDRAAQLEEAAKTRIAESMNIMGRERAQKRVRMRPAGIPR
jgi:hypothetical protein